MTEGGGGLIFGQNCVTSFMNAPLTAGQERWMMTIRWRWQVLLYLPLLILCMKTLINFRIKSHCFYSIKGRGGLVGRASAS